MITIPSDLLHIVADKVVSGCEYVMAERIVEKPFEVHTYFAHEDEIPENVFQVLENPSSKRRGTP